MFMSGTNEELVAVDKYVKSMGQSVARLKS